jgi:hypothetical protein
MRGAKEENPVVITDLSHISPAFFITGAIFILLIGSLLSWGVLSFFQKRVKRGAWLLTGAAFSLAAMLFVFNTWFPEA